MRSMLLFILPLILSSCTIFPHERLVKNKKGKITFCIAGDVGNGSSSQMEVARAMRASGCKRLVLLGDLIYPNGIKSADDTVLREYFYKPYGHFKYIYPVLGNHDYQGNVKAWREIASANKKIIHPTHYFRLKIKDSCLFFLDTNFHASVDLYEKESQWISHSTEGCRFLAGFSHHPFISSGKRHGPATDKVKEFYEKNVIGKFAMVFSGHEHIISDEGEVQGTRQIISGAGGKYDDGENPGFVIFTLDLKYPEQSSYSLIRI